MSKSDRDRLVAGRENRGFSYTEESGDGKEGRDYFRRRRLLMMNSLSGEGNISLRGACLKGVSLVGSYFDGTRPSFSEEWHRLNGEEGNVVSVTPLRP